MGPGYYPIDHSVIEKKVLCYSGCKEDAKSFLDKIMSKKETSPGPGHLGIPSDRITDRSGHHKHTNRMLMDRKCVAMFTPRGIDSAR